MLTTIFPRSAWLPLIRSTPALPFLDNYITRLTKSGYRAPTQRHISAAGWNTVGAY
jgi:hypothetical protein